MTVGVPANLPGSRRLPETCRYGTVTWVQHRAWNGLVAA
jgi:hypothetical protein